jgi:hypothetical protein
MTVVAEAREFSRQLAVSKFPLHLPLHYPDPIDLGTIGVFILRKGYDASIYIYASHSWFSWFSWDYLSLFLGFLYLLRLANLSLQLPIFA